MSRSLAPWVLSITILALSGLTPPTSADVYGVKSCGSDPLCPGVVGDGSDGPVVLFRLSDDGQTLTSVGNVTVSGQGIDVDGLAIAFDGRMVGFELIDGASGPPTGSRLVEVDASTGAAVVVGPDLPAREIRGAVFDRSDRLWAYDGASSELLEIDPATGAVLGAPVPLTLDGAPFSGHTIADLAVRTDGVLFYTQVQEFYALDRENGALTMLASDSAVGLDGVTSCTTGAAFVHSTVFELFSLEVCGVEDIYAYDTEAGYLRGQPQADILPAFNSGRGDLASQLPICPAPPGEVEDLRLTKAAGGAEILFTWLDEPNSLEYAVFLDGKPDGAFALVEGTATTGFTGVQTPMPSADAFYLVAGIDAPCIGPK